MLVTIMNCKRVENVFNQHDFGVEEMKIVFCCCGCSSWENIDIGIDGKYRVNIVSNEKAGIAHPYI
jgi:hypothetical protein